MMHDARPALNDRPTARILDEFRLYEREMKESLYCTLLTVLTVHCSHQEMY